MTRSVVSDRLQVAEPQPAWPVAVKQPVVFLTDRLTTVERAEFEQWLAESAPRGWTVDVVHLPPAGRLDESTTRLLDRYLARADDPLLVPIGAVWDTSTGRGSIRAVATSLLTGDPRRPRETAQRWIARRGGRTCRLVVGESANVSVVRGRFAVQAGGDQPGRLASYTSRHATLAVERAMIRQLGPEYKIPRLVRAEIAASAAFRSSMEQVATKAGRPFPDVWSDAEAALDELVTGWGRMLIDFQAQLGRWVYQLGYDNQIEYDDAQVARAKAALDEHAGVILMSHRSHLDGIVLPVALGENRLPRAHLLGGVNMAFWPLGAVMRRAGVIFIRREFRDDLVYKTVLRQYVGYLLEKRFQLQWSIEGTRSRTGKMEPPKLGLLSYVVDALREGRANDAVLIPVSIAYDQIHEVSEFEEYARGADKQAEGLSWMYHWLQAQRRGYGKIYVSFAEPISVRAELNDFAEPRDPNELYKLAFEVSLRLNEVTPVTGAALLATLLLGVRGRALTLDQIRLSLDLLLADAAERELSLAASARGLETPGGVVALLGTLEKHNVVTRFDGGDERVWMIEPDHYHSASFYRNSIIHFFLDSAVCELALVGIAERPSDDPVQQFFDDAYRLRDLFKFDFFFPGHAEFRAQLAHEMARRGEDWEGDLKRGEARGLLAASPLLMSSVMLTSYLEAYSVVADVLIGTGSDEVDEKDVRKQALGLGKQYVLQQKVHSSEAASSFLFRTGAQLAASRGLLQGGADTAADRSEFGAELRALLRRVEVIQGLVEERLAGRLTD